MPKEKSSDEWHCIKCLGNDGRPFRNGGSRSSCGGKCKLPKGTSFGKIVVKRVPSESAMPKPKGDWDKKAAEKPIKELKEVRQQLEDARKQLKDHKRIEVVNIAADDMDTDDAADKAKSDKAIALCIGKLKLFKEMEVADDDDEYVQVTQQLQRLRAAKDLAKPLLNRHREAQQRVNAAKVKVQKAELGFGELQKELQDLQAKVRDGYEKHAILKSALEAEEAKLESVLREPTPQPTAPAAANIAGSLPSIAELQALPLGIRESLGLSPTILEKVAKAVALAAEQRLAHLQQQLIQQDAETR